MNRYGDIGNEGFKEIGNIQSEDVGDTLPRGEELAVAAENLV